ncbi:phosphoglycerate mutase [Candidatus Woesearchaeota archaeon CG10_big_fil_rev_8_21_14_0_10_34_12]|nr:MAG: phosphoglycerate mutase [Candidatus Woesearchaeota archaeon CG10_big_fil_rev_8_21_14_0_10_34_12]
MDGIFVILDGLGDMPCKELNGMTPLEAAETPNLDWLAENGKQGLVYPVNKDYVPESDTAVVSLLGNDPFISSRGVFEAIGSGIEIKRGDLCLRTNFATISGLPGKIIDRRAGRTLTQKEAEILASEINKQVKLPCKFIFKPTVQHRGVLVLRGGLSDNITNTDSAYQTKGKFHLKNEFSYSKAEDEEENTEYTANLVNGFIEQTYKLLNQHPVNLERKKKNLMPANIILTRDAGVDTPKLKKHHGWGALAYMPLEIGIAKVSGMEVCSFQYPKMENYDVYKNLYDGLDFAIEHANKCLKSNDSYFYIHFKETDVPGHDGRALDKKKMIEIIDRDFFSNVRKIAEKKVKIIVTGDHSTPCVLKSHSSKPVPVLIFGNGKDNTKRFSEKEAEKGELGKFEGNQLLKIAGFN